MNRSDLKLVVAAMIGAAVFFSSLDRIWPLAQTDINASTEQVIARARQKMTADGHAAASALYVDADILDYLLRKFGMAATQRMIRDGDPIYIYSVVQKKYRDPDTKWVEVHPARGVIGWGRTMQEDAAGAALQTDAARALATSAVTLEGFREAGHQERDRPSRRDHFFIYERYRSRDPELRERVTVAISGDRVTGVDRMLVLPESARREAREREAPIAAMQMASFILLGIAGLAALFVFLTSLQRGEVQLKRAAGWVGVIATCYAITQALRTANLLAQWDPLWPRWIANFRALGEMLAQGAWIAFALFIVVAAGDALDRRAGANRGVSFWRLGLGHLRDRAVGIASLRGFLVGLVCGGTLVGTLLLLEKVAGAWVSIQPQGFFFFAINSSYPAVSTALYFFMVALVEELAYRFFAGTWLLSLTGKKWIAIVVPAILYGASHTGLDFLPPSEPFWGRAVALTAVGLVWGWAYFRYDALTVVLSHFAADIFVFSWPRLGSGDPILITKAILTMLVPLLPAVLLLWPRNVSRREAEAHADR
jgi:hypothetical protein